MQNDMIKKEKVGRVTQKQTANCYLNLNVSHKLCYKMSVNDL